MKLCKDCKHYQPSIAAAAFGIAICAPSMCMHPSLFRIEPTEGRQVYRDGADADPRISRERGMCGIEALMFEAKEAA